MVVLKIFWLFLVLGSEVTTEKYNLETIQHIRKTNYNPQISTKFNMSRNEFVKDELPESLSKKEDFNGDVLVDAGMEGSGSGHYQDMTTDLWDGQDSLNITVDEIFNETHVEYSKPEKNPSGPISDIIERWLTDTKISHILAPEDKHDYTVSPVIMRTTSKKSAEGLSKKYPILIATTERVTENKNINGEQSYTKAETTPFENSSTDLTTVAEGSVKAKIVMEYDNNRSDEGHESYFQSNFCAEDLSTSTSLNGTVKLFINNKILKLPSRTSINATSGIDYGKVFLRWNNVENIYNISCIFIINYKDHYFFIDAIHIKIVKYNNDELLEDHKSEEEKLIVGKTDLQLFKTEMGGRFKNDTEIIIYMEHGIALSLSNVEFAVNQTSKNSKGGSKCPIAGHYLEVMVGFGGIALIAAVIIYIARKLKRNERKHNVS